MSSIPNTKMKHAHVHHDAPAEAGHEEKPAAAPKAGAKPDAAPAPAPEPETKAGRAHTLADEAVAAVKEHPKTVAAIGAAVLAGAAALFGGPAIAKAVKGEPGKPTAKKALAKKPAARKPAAKKVKG